MSFASIEVCPNCEITGLVSPPFSREMRGTFFQQGGKKYQSRKFPITWRSKQIWIYWCVELGALLMCSLFQSMLQNAAIAMGSLRDCKKSQICKCQRACGAKSACKFGSHPCWVVSFAQPPALVFHARMAISPLHCQGRPWGSQMISWRRSPFTAGQSPCKGDPDWTKKGNKAVRSTVAGWSCVWKVDPNSFQFNAFCCFCWFRQHFYHGTKRVSLFRGLPNFCCLKIWPCCRSTISDQHCDKCNMNILHQCTIIFMLHRPFTLYFWRIFAHHLLRVWATVALAGCLVFGTAKELWYDKFSFRFGTSKKHRKHHNVARPALWQAKEGWSWNGREGRGTFVVFEYAGLLLFWLAVSSSAQRGSGFSAVWMLGCTTSQHCVNGV